MKRIIGKTQTKLKEKGETTWELPIIEKAILTEHVNTNNKQWMCDTSGAFSEPLFNLLDCLSVDLYNTNLQCHSLIPGMFFEVFNDDWWAWDRDD
jgi:hypothetical protein